MSVSIEDRKDYEQGQRDRYSNFLYQHANGDMDQHPDSDAYYKGRNGETLENELGNDKTKTPVR